MRELAVLILHVLTTVARLAGPGGARAVVAESVLRALSDAAGGVSVRDAPATRTL